MFSIVFFREGCNKAEVKHGHLENMELGSFSELFCKAHSYDTQPFASISGRRRLQPLNFAESLPVLTQCDLTTPLPGFSCPVEEVVSSASFKYVFL